MSRIGHTPMCERGAYCHRPCPGCPGGPSLDKIEASIKRLMERTNVKILDIKTHWWFVIDPRHQDDWSTSGIRRVLRVPKVANDGADTWSWDGNELAPTITPSIDESWGPICEEARVLEEDGTGEYGRNHYIISAGTIQFCGDSTHKWAGQTLPLPDFTETEIRYFTGETA